MHFNCIVYHNVFLFSNKEFLFFFLFFFCFFFFVFCFCYTQSEDKQKSELQEVKAQLEESRDQLEKLKRQMQTAQAKDPVVQDQIKVRKFGERQQQGSTAL